MDAQCSKILFLHFETAPIDLPIAYCDNLEVHTSATPFYYPYFLNSRLLLKELKWLQEYLHILTAFIIVIMHKSNQVYSAVVYNLDHTASFQKNVWAILTTLIKKFRNCFDTVGRVLIIRHYVRLRF